MSRTYIRTVGGGKVEPLYGIPLESIRIEDIAHSLGTIARFTGHTRDYYYVAQHSVLVALKAPVDLQLDALLHDASDAYVNDIARPLKHSGQPWSEEFRRIEKRVQSEIAARFNLLDPEPGEIQLIDRRMMSTEIRDLLPEGELWQWEPYPERIIAVDAYAARGMFCGAYEGITGKPVMICPRNEGELRMNRKFLEVFRAYR